MQSHPWYRSAASLGRDPRCTCCERPLEDHAVRMLEYDQRTWTYHDFGGVPEDRSQGWFPFGLRCARNKVKEAEAKLAREPS